MKRMLRTAVAVKLAALLLAIAAPSVVSAATEAYLDGSPQSNACFGYAGSDSGPVAFRQPFDDVGLDAIFPPVALAGVRRRLQPDGHHRGDAGRAHAAGHHPAVNDTAVTRMRHQPLSAPGSAGTPVPAFPPFCMYGILHDVRAHLRDAAMDEVRAAVIFV